MFIGHLMALFGPILAAKSEEYNFNGLIGNGMWVLIALPATLMLPAE